VPKEIQVFKVYQGHQVLREFPEIQDFLVVQVGMV